VPEEEIRSLGALGNGRASVPSSLDGSQNCGAWSSVTFCDGYDVVIESSFDTGEIGYYDDTSGQLVALVSTGNAGYVCLGGPRDFVLPSSCPPSVSLCDLLADGGGDSGTLGGEGGPDAPSEATDSGGE
jgi:hypothetical protein